MTERDQKKLGRGLNALIGTTSRTPQPPPAAATPATTTPPGREIPIDLIDPNPWQPRREFAQAEIDELADSIRANGLLQPILVRKTGVRFQLVAGERRLRATRQTGAQSIAANVTEVTDRQMLEWAIVENLQRKDLNPIEAALAFKRLMEEFALTQEQVSARVGQSRPHVANTLRLLELPGDIREMVSRGTLSAGAGRALLAVPNAAEQRRLAEQVAAGKATVRDVEAAGARKKDVRPSTASARSANLKVVAQELQSHLGTKVEILGTATRGRVILSYFTGDDLNKIYALLTAKRPRDGEPADDDLDADLTV